MVAYKKLTNIERDNISNKMETIRRNKEITDRIEKLSKEIEDALWDEVPNEVKDFYKKFPRLTNVAPCNLYGENFLTDNKQNDYRCRYIFNVTFKLSKVLNNYYNNYVTYNTYPLDNNPLIKYIKTNYPELYYEAREIVYDAVKICEWARNVRCILQTITTLNKLKDEFPEAYEIYESMYTSSKCTKIDKTGKEFNMCDAIEKVRAEFNSSLN